MGKRIEGWLVIARYKRTGVEFATHTVPCEQASDAISSVLRMGFAFGHGANLFTLRAVKVPVVSESNASLRSQV